MVRFSVPRATSIVYRNGQWNRLLDILPPNHGYSSLDGRDINDSGQVIARGVKAGVTQMVLLTPTLDPDFELAPDPLQFTLAGSQNVTVNNTGTVALNLLASATTDSGGNWLSVPPAMFSLPIGQQTTLPVSVDFSQLQAGSTHTGTVSVTSGGVTRTVHVTVTVPLADEVVWGPGGPVPEPGLGVTVGGGQPAILAPVSYRLGSRLLAQLSVEAWDQAGNHLGGTDERLVAKSEGTALTLFKIAGFGANTIPAGVTSITVKALLTTDDGSAVLAASSPAVYPLVAPLTVEWGQTIPPGDIFGPRNWDRIVATAGSPDTRPAARVTLPASTSDRRGVGIVKARAGGTELGWLGLGRADFPAGSTAPVTLAMGTVDFGRFPRADELDFLVVVGAKGASENQASLRVPVVSVRISKSSVRWMGITDSSAAPELTIDYRPGSGAGWDVVVLDLTNQSVRTLVPDATGPGQVTVNNLNIATQMNAISGGPKGKTKLLNVRIGLRQNGVLVASDDRSFVDERDRPGAGIFPGSGDLVALIEANLSLRSVTTTANHTLTPRTETISPTVFAGNDEGAAPAGTPSGGTGIARKWSFGTTIPENGSFSASLTLEYLDRDLPDDPGFAESRMQIVAFDPAMGTYKALPTVIDPAAKTATAAIVGLAPAYTLGVVGPAASRFLDFPLWRSDGSLEGRYCGWGAKDESISWRPRPRPSRVCFHSHRTAAPGPEPRCTSSTRRALRMW